MRKAVRNGYNDAAAGVHGEAQPARAQAGPYFIFYLIAFKHNAYFLPRIRYIPVPQTEQVPFIARRSPPFPGMVTSTGSFISRFCLHLTQYPITGSAIIILLDTKTFRV